VSGLALATLITLVLGMQAAEAEAAVPRAVAAAKRSLAASAGSRWDARPSGNGYSSGNAPPSAGFSLTWMGTIGQLSSAPGTPRRAPT
jgi:hypothetical protein